MAAMFLIAQSGDTSSIFVWAGVLIAVIVVLAAAVAVLRKKLSPNEDFTGAGFTLSDLRKLHKEGKLTDAEFEVAKNKLLLAAKRADVPKPPAPPS